MRLNVPPAKKCNKKILTEKTFTVILLKHEPPVAYIKCILHATDCPWPIGVLLNPSGPGSCVGM